MISSRFFKKRCFSLERVGYRECAHESFHGKHERSALHRSLPMAAAARLGQARPGAWALALHRVFPRGGRGPGTWSSSAAFPDTLAGCCIGVEQPGLGVVPVWMPALRQRLDLLEQCRPLNFTQGLARASRSPFFSLSSCCLSALVSRAGGSTLLTRLQQLPLIETCRGRVVQPRSHLPRNPVD